MSEKKIGFIISGAAALISQELALAYHLIEEKGIIPTVLAGTSSGSLCSLLINGVLQHKAGKGNFSWDVLKEVIFGLKNQMIYTNSALLDSSNQKKLKHIFGTISDVFSGNKLKNMVRLFIEVIKDRRDVKDIAIAGLDAWKNGYLLNTEPLIETLNKYANSDEYLGYKTFGDCFIPTYISAVNNQNGKTHRFYSKNKTDAKLNPANILAASIAVPVIFPPRKVDDISYVDGGTATDGIPVEDMIQDGLFDEVYILAPQISDLISGDTHSATQVPLVSNLLFALQVSHSAIKPFQLARSLSLVKDKTKALFYSPILTKKFKLLNFNGNTQKEQFDLSLSWAQNNEPIIIEELLLEMGFPIK